MSFLLCFDIEMFAMLGEEEPLVSHTVESDIKVLKKDSLIMSKVSSHIDTPVISFKKFGLFWKTVAVFMK